MLGKSAAALPLAAQVTAYNMGTMHHNLKLENNLLSCSGDMWIAGPGATYVYDTSCLICSQSYACNAVFKPGYAAPKLVGCALCNDPEWQIPATRMERMTRMIRMVGLRT